MVVCTRTPFRLFVEQYLVFLLLVDSKFLKCRIRCLAGPILAKFMDFITYEYMIENVMLILKAASTGRTDVADIMEQCHPLGRFDESIMRSIAFTVMVKHVLRMLANVLTVI